MSATASLLWIEQHARSLIIQDLPVTARRKNRVLIEYQTGNGQTNTCGGCSINHAVQLAAARIAAERKAAS